MDIVQMITDYGVDTLVIALCTVVFTGLFKIPIKKLADKTKNSKKITRFVTFLPILIGFGLTVLCRFLITKEVQFDRDFYIQWLSAVSISLAIYAFWEKFVPSEKNILSEAEIEANKEIVEELKNKLAEIPTVNGEVSPQKAVNQEIVAEVAAEKAVNHKKIVLTNNKNN